jgi:outer membrane protein assembly factor BamB
MKFGKLLLFLIPLLILSLGGYAGWRVWQSYHVEAEWPEFRGPTQDGHSTAVGLPVEWSATQNVLWKTDLPGRAWSSPIVSGGRIYLTNATTANHKDDPHDPVTLHMLALDASDGKLLWDQEIFVIEHPYPPVGFHDKNSHASPTPVYDHGRLYAQFGNFGTACLDESGKILWKTQEPAYKTELGNGGCPIVLNDLMIFNCDGTEDPFVVALDKATGQIRWKTMRTKPAMNRYALSTPTVLRLQISKDKQVTEIITAGTREVQALDPADGHEIWHVFHDGYCSVPRPVCGCGLVFATTGFERPHLLAIEPDANGKAKGTHMVWDTDQRVPLTPSPLIVGDDFYMAADNGMVSCLDAKTGNVWWQERVGKVTSASLFYGDGKIYLQDEYGKGYVFKPGHKLEIIATNDLGDKSYASYAVYRNRFIIRTQHSVWCIGESSAK